MSEDSPDHKGDCDSVGSRDSHQESSGPKIAPITKGIATQRCPPPAADNPKSEDSPDHKGDCDTIVMHRL